MVSNTLALLIYKLVNVFIKVILSGSRAAAPKWTKSCRTQGEFLSVHSFIRLSIHPLRPQVRPLRPQVRPQLRPLKPDSGLQSPDSGL